jgi:apolipoprotein D and lipocalin family protein
MQGYRVAWAVLSAALMVSLTGCFSLKRHGELPTAPNVNLQNVLGTWYVQGAMTTLLDRSPSDATITFTQNRDGTIRAEYEFTPVGPDAEPKIYTARVRVGETPGDWDVRFVWPFENDYRVLHVDSESMILGHPTRKYLYVMSRSKSLPQPKLRWLLDLAASRGFDTSYLKLVPHT